MRRLIGLGLALVAPLVAPATVARADAAGGAGNGEIWAGVQLGRPGSSGGSGCTWSAVRTIVPGSPVAALVVRTIDGRRYWMAQRDCPSGRTIVWVPVVTPADLGTQAADAIRARLPAPAGGFAPPPSAGIAKVGMWFWTASSTWRPVSITAWVPTPDGVLSSTVTARPVRLTLAPGDEVLGGAMSSCAGPGRVWQAELGDAATSPCQHTYEHASSMIPGGAFTARLGIDWQISWRSSDGQRGSLPSYTTTSRYEIEVDEIGALVTR